jgi:hypothetical protein
MNLERHFPAEMDRWLDQAIGECERQIGALDFQLKVDQGYVDSPEAEPAETAYYRCQLALNLIERECLEKKLALLNQWSLELGREGPRAAPQEAQG